MSEASASQAIATLRDLCVAPLTDARVDPNGGAIASGHPLGMSGARIAISAVKRLCRIDGRHVLAFMCIGVGQDLAVLQERV